MVTNRALADETTFPTETNRKTVFFSHFQANGSTNRFLFTFFPTKQQKTQIKDHWRPFSAIRANEKSDRVASRLNQKFAEFWLLEFFYFFFFWVLVLRLLGGFCVSLHFRYSVGANKKSDRGFSFFWGKKNGDDGRGNWRQPKKKENGGAFFAFFFEEIKKKSHGFSVCVLTPELKRWRNRPAKSKKVKKKTPKIRRFYFSFLGDSAPSPPPQQQRGKKSAV